MIDLSNLSEIKKLDPKNVYGSTELFVKQCEQIHEQIKDFEPSINSSDLHGLNNLVICGMGGSLYGGYVAMSLFKDKLSLPIYLNNDYSLPLFVDCNTLVLLTSYSGSTEEILECYDQAKTKNAYIVGLTSGGKLGKYLKKNDDKIIFNPKNNPSGQPRLGTGYIVLGTIEILRKLGLIKLQSSDIKKAIDEASSIKEKVKKTAFEIAPKILGFIPLIFAGDFLTGNAHILRNQFNETAKSFSSYHVIPEANHHVMEGLKNPEDRKLIGLFLDSSLYSKKIQKRMELTRDVVEKNNVSTISYKISASTTLGQSLEVLLFGGYLTFYLAILYKQDPSIIPWVDYFKEKLKDSS